MKDTGHRPVNKLEFAGMPRRAIRAWQAGGYRYAIGPSRFGTLAAKLEFTDHCQRLLLEEKLSPKVTDEV